MILALALTMAEDVYLKGYADGREAKAGISSWMTFYNAKRPHQALAGSTPMAVVDGENEERGARLECCGGRGRPSEFAAPVL